MKFGRLFSLAIISLSLGLTAVTAQRASEATTNHVDDALFTRAEFFGAQALLPYPTAEARNRLAEVQKRYPQDSGISLKLAELDEKLGNIDRAHQEMLRYVELEKNSLKSLEKLADFYRRRARFTDEASVRERMIAQAPRNERAPILQSLIESARLHRLERYQKPEFFQRLIASDPRAFEVVRQFIDHLVEQKDYAQALRALRQHKATFPEEKRYFLEKEVDALLKLKREGEAEALYVKAFDPFWSEEQSERFYYGFLSERDRLRAYGRELKQSFRRNPANFDVAVRLFHYLHYDYGVNDATAAGIFTQLEKARATRGVKWTADELAGAAQLLIANEQIDLASRFLYTLHQQGRLQQGSELRAKVLYQLFKLFAEAGEERTPFTAGDLKFYRDVAQADPHPGMLGGVLSLVLADANLQGEFEDEETTAVAHFNRAAAYRLFNAYKKEYPTSPELAQMYLDLIRLDTSLGEANITADLLSEFENRHSDAPQFPEVALKLADCYIGRKEYDRERTIYQRVLDYLGKRRKAGTPLVPSFSAFGVEDLTTYGPGAFANKRRASFGIRVEGENGSDDNSQGYSRATQFHAVPLISKNKENADKVTYAEALERYVASLARENRMAEILALYVDEIKKYPDEQGLYEELLQWLGQTNLVDEQLRVYQDAIKRFPTNIWNDRLARWYLRRERKQEFEQFSNELLQKLDDREVENYLIKFINTGDSDKASVFDQKLYLGFYKLAHERFPHNLKFVDGLLGYYSGHKQWDDWRRLIAEYYFESKQIREKYLLHLASNDKLREHLIAARQRAGSGKEGLAYKLFRADAAVWLSNYEEAVDAYRELNELYPNTPEFAERFVAFTRSFGQKDQKFLIEAASVQRAMANASPWDANYRTAAGEIFAELGDYKSAGDQWERLIDIAPGDEETYLDAATVYWDYFQYADALRVIKQLRRQRNDHTRYAFQAAAILEAQHQTKDALGEYVKALDQELPDHWRAQRRLKTLCNRDGIQPQLSRAFQTELARSKNREQLALGYVNLLDDVGRRSEASLILKREAARSRSQNFLDDARDYFRDHDDDGGEIMTLRRLITAAKNDRFAISYQLQLAEHTGDEGKRAAAAAILGQLVNKFPANYWVLRECADFLWRLGHRDQAISLLARAERQGRGRFHYIFARKLAARQIERGKLAAAEHTLKRLYDENPRNSDVFNELSRIYVRTSRPESLRERYRETIRAIKQSKLDRNEIRDQIGALREQVIEAFTQLKDYESAIEQHIEIINRDPDDEENVNAAIRYAKRYGGADRLIDYYTKTSGQAYKDYRWNLVLARIYDAKKDWESASRELRKAIANQPEMVELHSELADVCLKAKDYKTAIESLEHACKLSNDDPQYLKRLAEALEKAGRRRESEVVRAKPPVEKPKTATIGEQFAEAERMRRDEKAKAIETYRKAFDAFAGDFYKHELRAHELAGYVKTLREEEPLDQILRRLWSVRERIERDVKNRDNLLAGKARSLLETFDLALPEAVGQTAAEYATGDELAAIDRDVKQWVNQAKGRWNADDTLIVLLNLSRRAGLGTLTEQILIERKENACAIKAPQCPSHVMSLVNFHSERGDYQKAIQLLERERPGDRDQSNYRAMIAEYALLIGDREKELQALRAEYQSRAGDLTTQTDQIIERYFTALLENGAAGRSELRRCAQNPTPYRFQLINFLVRNNEMQLAREAINAAHLPDSWKSSRTAELITVTRDLNQANEPVFQQALHLKTIGETIGVKLDQSRQIVGDDWFYLAENYGRWLALAEKASQKPTASSGAFLPAMLENRPKDANEQHRLGRWYLEQNNPQKALEHLTIAGEMNPDSKQIIADIGSAHFNLGDRRRAREEWNRVIEGDKPEIGNCLLYLRTLSKHGLAIEARAKLKPFVINRLSEINGENDDEMESLKPLIRGIAASFESSTKNEVEKADFMRNLCESARRDVLLAEMIIRETLVARNHLEPFYRIVVRSSDGLSRYDYDSDFVDRRRAHPNWSVEEIEESLDHENATKAGSDNSTQFGRRIEWQKEYLDYLVAERRTNEATMLVSEIEKEFNGKYPRPDWLRLAKLRVELRAGRVIQAVNGLKHFVGAETGPRIDKIAPPNLERMNQVSEMLRREGRRTEAGEIVKSVYERMLALEQLQSTSFVGLARLAFENGDADRGLKLLNLMIEVGNAEARETAAAELASLPWVKARSVDADWVETPQPCNQIQETDALSLAAETAAEFSQPAVSIEYRRRLSKLSPEDHLNKLELARLYAAVKNEEEAVSSIAPLMTDRLVPRQTRWTAIWIAPEIATWQSLNQRVKDQEASKVLEALSLFHRKQFDEAIKISGEAQTNNLSAQFKLFHALLQKNAGREGEALQSFFNSMVAIGDVSIAAPFSASEDELRWQIIRLYARQGRPRAALKLASADERLKDKAEKDPAQIPINENESDGGAGLKSLGVLAANRRLQSQIELLALLSVAAEQTDDLIKSAGFERARLSLLANDAERRKTESRIEQLTAKQKEKSRKKTVSFAIDQSPVTRR